MNLKAVVVGAGWAGEGHTIALREAGVEVVAMCGRTPEPAYAMAQKLGVPNVRFDWHQSVLEFKPDIVAIATPAAPHLDIAVGAANLGCHILCDKPLARTAADASAMLLAAERAAVKHAYGPTSCCAPVIEYARKVVADGLIGKVVETEAASHLYLPGLLPYNWIHSLEQGGGMLNNGFTHALAQVLTITGARVQAAMGETRILFDRTPVGRALHDFRDIWNPSSIVSPESAQAGEWREVDADFAYTVMVQLRMPQGNLVRGLFQWSCMSQALHGDHLSIHGTDGTLHISGRNADSLQHYDSQGAKWADLTVPNDNKDGLPPQADYIQRDWNELFDRFVKDIRGEPHLDYPSFHDGWVASEVIEIARAGSSWTEIKARPVV